MPELFMSTVNHTETFNMTIADQEQEICKSCGICCGGALFNHVELLDADIARKYVVLDLSIKDDTFQFNQPCNAFSQTSGCQIYEYRPDKCQKFYCRLIKKFKKNKIGKVEALKIITSTKNRINSLYEAAAKTGLFSEAELGNIRCIINRMQEDLSTTEALKKYTDLYFKYAALRFLLGDHFIRTPLN